MVAAVAAGIGAPPPPPPRTLLVGPTPLRRAAGGAGTGAADPGVVIACAGDVPDLETPAAVTRLRGSGPDVRIRVVNVVDLMALRPSSEHPQGLDDGRSTRCP